MVFNNYAKYYDLLYKDKDYPGEVDYIDSLIKAHLTGDKVKVLDIGCGTGTHAGYLAQKGYHVTGIDQSAEMVDLAIGKKIPNAEFYVQNATNFKLDSKFDVILSLFHVVSYQTANQSIADMFASVAEHLSDNGLFIFDFWYGPAVLADLPAVRVKRLEDDTIKVFRLAEPDIYRNENTVDVKYELIIYNKLDGQTSFVNESHLMRYLFLPEIDAQFEQTPLKTLKYEEWLTGNTPSEDSWGVVCVAQKVK